MSEHSKKLSRAIVRGMQEKKAQDIVILDLRKIKNTMSDFFVICSGGSSNQLSAIADGIARLVSKSLKENPWHIEGQQSEEWMLLDYVTVVAHIFQREQRSLYKLEGLWGNAQIVEIKN